MNKLSVNKPLDKLLKKPTNRLRYCLLALPLLLSGCLEVDQHPEWLHGQYAGKQDNRHFQVRFHNDRLAWAAAINDRSQKQNEYNRANP